MCMCVCVCVYALSKQQIHLPGVATSILSLTTLSLSLPSLLFCCSSDSYLLTHTPTYTLHGAASFCVLRVFDQKCWHANQESTKGCLKYGASFMVWQTHHVHLHCAKKKHTNNICTTLYNTVHQFTGISSSLSFWFATSNFSFSAKLKLEIPFSVFYFFFTFFCTFYLSTLVKQSVSARKSQPKNVRQATRRDERWSSFRCACLAVPLKVLVTLGVYALWQPSKSLKNITRCAHTHTHKVSSKDRPNQPTQCAIYCRPNETSSKISSVTQTVT